MDAQNSMTVQACDCCGFTTETQHYGDDLGVAKPRALDLCSLCASTYVGTKHGYGQATDEAQAICYVGNVVLAKIQELIDTIKEGR